MQYVLDLRKDEAEYQKTQKGNPCFYRNYYTDQTMEENIQFTSFDDLKKGHGKWEGRIQRALKTGLESTDWMEKRNALVMLSKTYTSFPMVEKVARVTLTQIETIKDKEERADVKTLAASLYIRLKSQKPNWVDRETRSRIEKEPGKEKRKEGEKDKDRDRDVAKEKPKANGPSEIPRKRPGDGSGKEEIKRPRRDEGASDKPQGTSKDRGSDGNSRSNRTGTATYSQNTNA